MKVYSKKLIAVEIDSDDPDEAMEVAREVPMWEWDQNQEDETLPPFDVFVHEAEALPEAEASGEIPHSKAISKVENNAGEVDYLTAVRAIARTKKANWLMEVEERPEATADPSHFWRWLAVGLAGTIEDIEIELGKLGIDGVDLDEASIANLLDDPNTLARLRHLLEEHRRTDYCGEPKVETAEKRDVSESLGATTNNGLRCQEAIAGVSEPSAECQEDCYEPNVTCPYCQDETMPTREMQWNGWGLEITQTCPVCGRRWYETWHLVRVELHRDTG